MGLFGKKKQVRFETITIESERSVFDALQKRGYILCTEPFQFDVEKSHQKLRKDAMSMAKDLHAELVVEVWDPIFNHMHWKGLKYAAWRKATPAELEGMRKKEEAANRPDYSDSMGSYDELQRKIEEKKLQVAQEDLAYFETAVKAEEGGEVKEQVGSPEDEMQMISENIKTVSTYNPYDHQGENQEQLRKEKMIDAEAASSGPVFDNDMKLDLDTVESADPTSKIDPLSMMMEAAGNAEEQSAVPDQPSPIPPTSPPPLPEAPPPVPGPAQVKKEETEDGQ